jgi:hypothetical protein
MANDEELGLEDTVGLTDADWAAINKLRKAYKEGGQKSLERAMRELDQDPVRAIRVSLLSAHGPESNTRHNGQSRNDRRGSSRDDPKTRSTANQAIAQSSDRWASCALDALEWAANVAIHDDRNHNTEQQYKSNPYECFKLIF